MSNFIDVLRLATRDRRIRPDELAQLITTAAEDGFHPEEVRQIVAALEQSEDGFTPISRAQLWVGLSRLGAQPALEALAQTQAKREGFHQLSESQAIVDLLMADAVERLNELRGTAETVEGLSTAKSPTAAGTWVPAEGVELSDHAAAVTALAEAQQRWLETTGRLRQYVASLSSEDLSLIVLALCHDWSASERLECLRAAPEAVWLAGLNDEQRQLAQLSLPEAPNAPTTARERRRVLGVTFADRVEWSVSSDGVLNLPNGAQLTSLPARGELQLSCDGEVSLPDGSRVSGRFRVVDGGVHLNRGARGIVDGIPFEVIGDDATCKGANGTLIGSAGVQIPLQTMPMPQPPDGVPPPKAWVAPETKLVRFVLEDTTLPDGTLLKSGQGEMTLLMQGGEAIGVLEDSIHLRPGAVVVKQFSGQTAVPIRGLGEETGELRRGVVYLKDGMAFGLGGYSEAMIDGFVVETGYEQAFVSFSAKRPATYTLGRGATITSLPDHPCTFSGEALSIKIGDQEAVVHSGSVKVAGGRIVELGPQSEVSLNGLRVKTSNERMVVLDAAPSRWPYGAALFVDRQGFELSGRGVQVTGAEGRQANSILEAPADGDDGEVSGIPNPSVCVRDGRVKVAIVDQPMQPRHLAVDVVEGEVSVASGQWIYRPDSRRQVSDLGENRPGPIIRIRDAGKTYEIDTRQMWSVAGGTELSGRFREIGVTAGSVFADPRLAGDVAALQAGSRTLRAGSRGETVKAVQQVLNHFLGDRLAVDSSFGQLTATAVRRFQRLNRLPPTGVVDAATFARLVAVAPPAAQIATPRPKVMVMVALNGDVPDELVRFRTLARERGAEAVILGHPEAAPGTSAADLEGYFQRAERGEIDFDWLVISGHSGGTSTWGSYGRLDYDDLARWAKQYPTAGAQIEKLNLLNCYNVTIERANSFWNDLFPNVVGLAGFMYSAPGKKAQTSDENLLHSGRLLASIAKGELPDRAAAERMGRTYATDSFIKWQNASMWMRYRDANGEEGSNFAMTASAEYEMRRHGAGDELEVTAFRQAQEYEKYFRADEEGYAEPPAQHHSGPLREYLNAVDGVMSRWESRLRAAERYARQAEQDPSFQIPEEYANVTNLRWQVERMQMLRGQVLFLIYFADVRRLFDEKYGHAIDAFNQQLASHGINERFPRGAELRDMNRQQVLACLQSLATALQRLPNEVRRRAIEDDAWRIMTGTKAEETMFASPEQLFERAQSFLVELDPTYIAAEWL